MSKFRRHPILMLGLGIALGAAAMAFQPQEPLKASSASGNDKFSMCTVATSVRNTTPQAVVVLDHLTGTLQVNMVGGNGFPVGAVRQCAADFQLNAATPDPKYALVSGTSNNQSGGLASGIIYVGELSSGSVVAYAFSPPGGRAAAVLTPIGTFKFRQNVGG